MDMPIVDKTPGHLQVVPQEPGLHTGEGPAEESQDAPAGSAGCAPVDEPFHDERYFIGLHWGRELPLIAEQAPVGTPQVRDEDRDDYRG